MIQLDSALLRPRRPCGAFSVCFCYSAAFLLSRWLALLFPARHSSALSTVHSRALHTCLVQPHAVAGVEPMLRAKCESLYGLSPMSLLLFLTSRRLAATARSARPRQHAQAPRGRAGHPAQTLPNVNILPTCSSDLCWEHSPADATGLHHSTHGSRRCQPPVPLPGFIAFSSPQRGPNLHPLLYPSTATMIAASMRSVAVPTTALAKPTGRARAVGRVSAAKPNAPSGAELKLNASLAPGAWHACPAMQ